MIVTSIGAATTIRISHCYGARSLKELTLAAKASYHLVIAWNLFAAITFISLCNVIPTFFTTNAEVIDLASNLMVFAALYQLSDGIQNVSVENFDGLTVEFAKKRHASVMVRGLRAVTDFENEIQLAQTNHALMPGIETMFLATSIKWSYLSSTIVKEAARYGSNISKFVTPNVENAIHAKVEQLRAEGNTL